MAVELSLGTSVRPWSEDGLDEEDMQWVDKQRGGRVSDAILSCPCCMEIVTIDCQKHAQYGGDQCGATSSTTWCTGDCRIIHHIVYRCSPRRLLRSVPVLTTSPTAMLDPHLLSQLISCDGASIRMLNPRFVSLISSYDVAPLIQCSLII